MDNPDNAAIQVEEVVETFGDKVSAVLKNIKRTDSGKIEFPDDIPEEVKYAALAEQRRRDTQAEFTKAKQIQSALEAEKTELLKKISSGIEIKLTNEQESELEDLKFSDPDKWRIKLNAYETEARSKQAVEVNELLKEVSAKNIKEVELENRKQILREFQQTNKDFVINDDIIENDIPPRITKKLQNNEITFEVFLNEVYEYMKKGKVVSSTSKTLDQPNLSKAGGSDSPSEHSVGLESKRKYETEIY